MNEKIEEIKKKLEESVPGPYGSYKGNAAEDLRYLLDLLSAKDAEIEQLEQQCIEPY